MKVVAPGFFYSRMTERNLGFVTRDEQESLRTGRVFVCGVGGMGGAALVSLARAGVGGLGVADPDRFEVSNLNRQLLATLDDIGSRKVDIARRYVHGVHPDASVESWGGEWVDELDEILPRYPVVVNGMDDVRAALVLYRKARQHGAVVVDAYTSPLPSVVRVGPADPRPEERLGFPSVGREPMSLSDDDVGLCLLREVEYVVTHSSSLAHVDFEVAAETLTGGRPRPSFAPMVVTAGQLLAGEALATLMGRATATDHRGWFLNPAAGRVERPRRGPVRWLRAWMARRAIGALVAGGDR